MSDAEKIVRKRIQVLCSEVASAGAANPTLQQLADAVPYAIVKYLVEERERVDGQIHALWNKLRDMNGGPFPGDK